MSDIPKLARIKQDDENMEKIHCAARRGQTELVRRLIASGIDPAIQNKFGCTALHLACKYGQSGCARELAPKTPDLSGAWHGQHLLHLAVQSSNVEVVKILVDTVKEQGKDVGAFLNETDDFELSEVRGEEKHVQGQTALHVAVTDRNLTMMKLLLELGASPVAKDKNGETALVRCIEFGLEEEFHFLTAVPDLRVDVVDRSGRAALFHAVVHQRPDMAQKLLDLGADCVIEDQDKETPLNYAAYAGYPVLLEKMLNVADPFAVQSAPFHNGVAILPERLTWMNHVTDEGLRNEVIKVLQKKLDLLKDRSATAGKGGKTGPMSLAPSAPVRRQ